MKLKDCIHGVLVTDKATGLRVGMIVGITNNRPSRSESEKSGIGYAIPIVRWSSGLEQGINAANIEIFKG